MVNNPSGTIFLKAVDILDFVKDGIKLFELLDSLVEETGKENVMQVVTNVLLLM